MVMTSTLYSEDDYERDFDRFMEWATAGKESEA